MRRLVEWMPVLSLVLAIGCVSSEESAKRDDLSAHVGKYDPAPSGLKRVKVGVPPFKIEQNVPHKNVTKEHIGREAADQLITLADKTDRFVMIERTQIEQLLKEQGLEGVVDPEELAQPGRVKGVDYLCLGRVTNFRVKAEKTGSSFDLGNLGIGGVFDYNNEKSTISVDCGVHIRFVDPTTGATLGSEFGEYKKIDSIGATGVRILGVGGGSDAQLDIREDSYGKLLLLALDDAMRKILPTVDKRLKEAQASQAPEMKCAGCGASMPVGTKFCAGCGAKVEEAPKAKMCACGKEVPGDAKFCPGCGAPR